MLTIRAMSDGKGYSSKHLEHSDYYAEGERVLGQWRGQGAELLGLSGEVKTKEFEFLRQSCHPETGEFLRQRQSSDRTSADGTTQSKGRNLYDFTISAPKSVSIMATLGGDRRLLQAHEEAVNEALHDLETNAAARIRRGGIQDDRITGNLVIAVYPHDSSRELDPQIHTHAVAANLTYDGTEGRWKALQASGIYDRRAYLSEVYRNALACHVRQFGYEIENHRNSKGRDCGFEIRGIPKELLDKYSQRSRQRDEAIERFTAANGRKPTDNEIAVLVRESRADKLIEISTREVHARQRERLNPEEARLLSELQSKGEAAFTPESAESSLSYAQEHIFERVSVCQDHEVLTEALRHGRGRIRHKQLKACLSLQESSGTVLRNGNEIATTASLKREREIIESINRGIGGFERMDGNNSFVISDRLNPEQKRVVEFVLGSRDKAVNISGAAGTGKTATLQELNRGLQEAGRDVLAIAPTVSAVEELQKVGFEDAITIERLLQDPRTQAEIKNKVLIVDEAGMISGRQMWELLHLTEQNSARIIFSGDTHQIQSVEACDALRILEKESRLKSALLTQVQRQTVIGYREAIQELRRDPERGFENLDEIGAVREIPFLDRPQGIAQAYIESKPQNALVVCATHDEIDRVTEAIRSARKKAGNLGKSTQLTRDFSLNWTAAQKMETRNFRPGHLLGFHRAVNGIAKNETVEVVQVENKGLIVRNEHGLTQTVTARQAKSFDVFERKDIEVASGDKLILNANFRTPRFRSINGEIVTVSRVDSKGRIHLDDGRTLPRHFRQFNHGYAVTAHRSQGKSVDLAIISADGMRKELFYVAASRGRKSVLVFTGDKQLLRESVVRSAARQSASELARRAKPSFRRGIHRGLAAAREMAKRAAMYLSSIMEKKMPLHHLGKQPGKEREHDHGISR
jgi:conjugative relaxase-like TrwC/TraI family protein